MDIIQTIVIGLGTLSLIVMVHEYGHFWMARRFGVTVERFSIGFGKPLVTWRDRLGTEFVVAPIPLGGYVKMYGEFLDEPEDGKKQEGSFNDKPVWQRSLIVVAGPAINILFAVLVYWSMMLGGQTVPASIIAKVLPDTPAEQAGLQDGDHIYSVDGVSAETWPEVQLQLLERMAESGYIKVGYRGSNETAIRTTEIRIDNFLTLGAEESPIRQLGIVPRPMRLPRIGNVLPDGSASRAGMQVGDVLRYANGERIYSWQDWVLHIRAHPDESQIFVVDRAGEEVALRIDIDAVQQGSEHFGRIGVSADIDALDEEVVRSVEHGVVSAFGKALQRSWDLSVLTLGVLAKMISGLVSPEELSGPITIVKISGEAASIDIHYYLELIALISLNLGLINLLPIPILDGGQLMYLGAEALRRKPLPINIQVAGQYVGIAIIGTLMIFVIYNDILRL